MKIRKMLISWNFHRLEVGVERQESNASTASYNSIQKWCLIKIQSGFNLGKVKQNYKDLSNMHIASMENEKKTKKSTITIIEEKES